jgi:hypothetical protein
LSEDPVERLVFVDESGASTQMTRRRGRAPLGQRRVAHVPQGHDETTTLVSAIRLTGPEAPWLFDGAMDGEMFLAWVRQGLVPVLHQDDRVIMDNLATHKVAGVRQAIEAAGATLLYEQSLVRRDAANAAVRRVARVVRFEEDVHCKLKAPKKSAWPPKSNSSRDN